MRFWDSSAIVPLLLFETSSESVEAVLATDGSMATWWATPVECLSAIGRRERSRSIDGADAACAVEKLARLAEDWIEVVPVEGVREMARRLVRVHDLRAADAFQLAAAVHVSERGDLLSFVTRDDRLALAASREGFPILGL